MGIQLKIGLDVIGSYRRLAYTPWHAIAEFVDNSTQSYFNNEEVLRPLFTKSGNKLHVAIVYQPNELLRISDDAMGMSYDELQSALHVAHAPQITTGRSKYGMGLKTAACWIGNRWTVRTKKLGETVEHCVEVNVNQVVQGNNDLPYKANSNKRKEEHYTVVEIYDHNCSFHGRTIGKIGEFLRSMYREDLRSHLLNLEWQAVSLSWEDFDRKLLVAQDGNKYKRSFRFEVGGMPVRGWVGILDKGSRSEAGFSILHCGRVIRGWPDSWRPTTLYGQFQGSNDLVNQRLVGEIHLDEFEVSHTKDDILWLGSQEEGVEDGLRKHCSDYRDFALKYKKRGDDQRGPSAIETETAIDELKRELLSPEMVDKISLEIVPPKEVVDQSLNQIRSEVPKRLPETFSATIGKLAVRVFIVADMSPNDPYVVAESAKPDEVIVIVNTTHPHWAQLKGSDGVLNYLRHCTYDAMAEWQARSKAARMDPDTIKMLKDQLLRVPFELEGHEE